MYITCFEDLNISSTVFLFLQPPAVATMLAVSANFVACAWKLRALSSKLGSLPGVPGK